MRNRKVYRPKSDHAGPTEGDIYGEHLSKVYFIRQRGWAVFKEGHEFRVGTKLGPMQVILDVYKREKQREEDRLKAAKVGVIGPKGKGKARRGRSPDRSRRPDHRGNRDRGRKTTTR